MPKHRYLVHAYRIATLPWRWWMLRKLKRQGKVPVGVLFYHRVDDQHLNPWTISNKRFVEQIDWLQANFDLVSLGEARRRIESGFNTRPTVSLTFDDGYADNCTQALPMLVQRNIPVTYFVSSQQTLEQRAFEHDAEQGQALPTNDLESLRALANSGIEIGAHTHSHKDLGSITDSQELYDEVIGGVERLEQALGIRIRYFAFPFGQKENLNQQVFQMCRDHGIEAVCSAYGGWNEIGGDSYHLQRFHGDHRTAWLQNWLTLDPRKRDMEGFQYQLETPDLGEPTVTPTDLAASFPAIPAAKDASFGATSDISNA